MSGFTSRLYGRVGFPVGYKALGLMLREFFRGVLRFSSGIFRILFSITLLLNVGYIGLLETILLFLWVHKVWGWGLY